MNKELQLKSFFSFKYILPLSGVIIYKILLEIVYVTRIVPGWEYSGFTISFDLISYVLSWLIVLAFTPLIFKNYNYFKPSDAIVTILFYLAFIPAAVLMQFKKMDSNFLMLFVLYWLLFLVLQRLLPSIKFLQPVTKDRHLIIYSVLVVISLTSLYVSYVYTGFRINLSIFNVYSLREEAREFDMFILVSYLYSASRALLPTLILYFIYQKRISLVIFLSFVQLLVYSVDGSKSVLFSLVFAIGGYLIFKGNRIHWIVWILSLINIIGLLEQKLFTTTFIIDIFIRRVMYLPQLLNYFYYDFFSQNEFDYFKQSILGKFGFNSDYQIRIPNIIGENYYGSSANNGLFSDAFYNLGILGILIMPILLIIAFRILDAASHSLDSRIIMGSVITSSLNFLSSSYFTVLLSHGFIAVCIVLYYLPRVKRIE